MILDSILYFLKEIAYFFNEIAIYLVFGFVVAGILHVLFPERFIIKHIGQNNLRSVLKATLGGIPLPLCSCGVIPVAASLRKKGAARGSTLSFLVATPQIGVDSFLVTYSLIGWVFGVFRIVASFITALAAGIISNFTSKEEVTESKSSGTDARVEDRSTTAERARGIVAYIQYELLGSFANYLMLGILIAGAITVFVPDAFFENYMSNPLYSMLLMLVAGIPMYVCATASTPIAASLILKGMSPGAALVFLLAGPATNAVTISTIIKTMGRRQAIIYVGAIAVVSLILGYLLNLLAAGTAVEMVQHQHEVLPQWLKIGGSVVLAIMLLWHYTKRYIIQNQSSKKIQTMPEITVLKVNGMTCNHCAESVRKAVAQVEGTTNVAVDLNKKQVMFEADDNQLAGIKKAIEDRGYEVNNKATL